MLIFAMPQGDGLVQPLYVYMWSWPPFPPRASISKLWHQPGSLVLFYVEWYVGTPCEGFYFDFNEF